MKTNEVLNIRESLPEDTTIRTALTRAVHEVLPERWGVDGLEGQLQNKRIKLYLGIDPTSPELHIGHTVVLRKLRQFQELGHEVVLLMGTFTGMIGDPTDKSAARKRLTREDVDRNVASYAEQAGKILDLSPDATNPVTIAYNHEWLGKMTFAEVVDLMSNFSVAQMLARRGFQDRMESGKPLWLHELTYPLMQGFDSVALGVDLEIGGRDQVFNMLVGADLIKRTAGKQKWVLATKLLEDPDGKKMGKTEGNIVNVRDWEEWLYESIMKWPDSAIWLGLELLTTVTMEEIENAKKMLEGGAISIYDLKMAFAYRVTKDLHGKEAANFAENEYGRVVRKGLRPERIRTLEIAESEGLAELLVRSGMSASMEMARQLISQGGVLVDGKKAKASTVLGSGAEVSLGKKPIKQRILLK